jgi:hydroxymethylbilane synthase
MVEFDMTGSKELPNPLQIGTRGSDLALWQAHHIQDRLADMGVETNINIIKTQGDIIDNVPFSKLEGKGFFTKELEDAQLDGRVDFAVHSMKDLATGMPDGLTLACLVGREDPRELLLIRPECVDKARLDAGELLPLADGARFGTSAARRQSQLKLLRPDLDIVDLRGNVPTRIKKLREGQYDAIMLATAGVTRLKLEIDDLWTRSLPVDGFVPAPAQGMLAIQCREEGPVKRLLARLNSTEAARMVQAERNLLEKLDGGCQLPFGVNIADTGMGFRLECFWQDKALSLTPLRFTLDGVDPDGLSEQAFERIREYAGD